MDSKDVRKLRCLERIIQVLKEEHCKLEIGVTIIGREIVNDQVFVIPLEAEEIIPTNEAPSLPDAPIEVVEPVNEPVKEGGTI